MPRCEPAAGSVSTTMYSQRDVYRNGDEVQCRGSILTLPFGGAAPARRGVRSAITRSGSTTESPGTLPEPRHAPQLFPSLTSPEPLQDGHSIRTMTTSCSCLLIHDILSDVTAILLLNRHICKTRNTPRQKPRCISVASVLVSPRSG